MLQNGKFLAFDTSTDVMSVAVTDGTRVWQHTGPGGAKASTTLIPAILALLRDAGVSLGDLQAIAFGRGPGSFTGLRTACAVAQGLAFGANAGEGVPVLPIDTLLAVAEEAKFQNKANHFEALQITALLDARMDEMYAGHYAFDNGRWTQIKEGSLIRPENLVCDAGCTLAGNVFAAYGARLPALLAQRVDALPTAAAMLRLAPVLLAAGAAVRADLALPRYIRDKVAKTTLERAVEKATL